MPHFINTLLLRILHYNETHYSFFPVILYINNAFLLRDERDVQKHLWMKSNQSNNPYSKLISLEHPRMNQEDWHLEHLEYLYNIMIRYSEILSNVTILVYLKLYIWELMDVRFGRSTFHHFQSFHYYFALSTNRNHYHIFHQVYNNLVKWIVMMEDLFKSFYSNSFNTFHYCW